MSMSKQQEVCLDDEPLYKSSPILDVESESLSNMQPPPLTRTLNIELHNVGRLDLKLDTILTKDDSLDNIVED